MVNLSETVALVNFGQIYLHYQNLSLIKSLIVNFYFLIIRSAVCINCTMFSM
jgi:hypothetical protein